MFVIKKGNLFVSRPGSKNSYTNKIENAQKFKEREDAEENLCGNERVVPLWKELEDGGYTS